MLTSPWDVYTLWLGLGAFTNPTDRPGGALARSFTARPVERRPEHDPLLPLRPGGAGGAIRLIRTSTRAADEKVRYGG
jgi:hypothetical protein